MSKIEYKCNRSDEGEPLFQIADSLRLMAVNSRKTSEDEDLTEPVRIMHKSAADSLDAIARRIESADRAQKSRDEVVLKHLKMACNIINKPKKLRNCDVYTDYATASDVYDELVRGKFKEAQGWSFGGWLLNEHTGAYEDVKELKGCMK